ASIDYAVKRIGIDHVAISSDFNHGGGVTGFEDEGDAPNVTKALIAKGYNQADINKLWGGNVLRVLRSAEAAKKKDLAQN
ncbi:MAG: membrane dipeptidase, partial [Alphaproteobacteria bacterium]